LTNSSASDTPTKNNKLLQARPKQQTAVSALNLRGGLRLLSRYSPTLTTQLPTPVPNVTSMHSPSLSQREPTAAVTLKNDFPPPRQPNENNKSLTLQISACVSPNLQSPCCCTGSFVPVSIQGQYPDLYNQYSLTTTTIPDSRKKSRRAPRCDEPDRGTNQEGEATQNLG